MLRHSFHRRLIVGLAFAIVIETTWSGSAAQTTDHRRLLVARWLQAVLEHSPGELDEPALGVAKWTRKELETVVSDLDKLSALVRTASELKARDPIAWQQGVELANGQREGRFVIRIGNERLTLDEVSRMFHGNRTLLRGAVLHADIAMHRAGLAERRVQLVEDGRDKGNRDGGIHWGIGRLVLDSLTPHPSEDPAALVWYRAASAYLLSEEDFSELEPHLAKARQVFPDDPELLLDAARAHEKLASPALQAGVEDLRERGIRLDVGSRQTELQRAEQLLRRVLTLSPEIIDAHLRLGRTLSELERHDDAAAVFRNLANRDLTRDQRYLTELFFGRTEQARHRTSEAQQHYENAATIFPGAQSAHIALSQLARSSGDRAAAKRHLAPVLDRVEAQFDPWWDYFEPHAHDVDDWVAAMHRLAQAPR